MRDQIRIVCQDCFRALFAGDTARADTLRLRAEELGRTHMRFFGARLALRGAGLL